MNRPEPVTARVGFSSAVSSMALSAIKEMAMRAASRKDVASLTWGLPSFRTPAPIRAAVEAALRDDPDAGKYALPDGLPALRELVAASHQASTGITVDPALNVQVTAGNMQGVNALLHVLLDPGDEVIVTDPGFASHIQQIRLCRGQPVYWPLDETRNWALDVDALAGLVSERTRALILVSPANPTGNIFPRADLLEVADLARSHGFYVIVDDPYSEFVYESRETYFNLARAGEFREQVLYLYTFSKAHAMSGWRLGYMIVPEAVKREVLKVHDATLICTPRISQIAGIAALGQSADHLRDFERTLNERRSLICERLDAMPHVFEYIRPEGAYYVFPRILAPHEDSREFALRVLDEANVTLTPGAAFGPGGEHHVRMAYCVDEETINIAFDRLEACFRK